MRNIWIIARKEYKGYFISPVAYAIAFMFLVIMGVIFYTNLIGAMAQQYPLGVEVVLGPMVTLFLFTIPAITMRTLAEEQRTGTMELLLTAPVRDYELVVGKWLGAFLFLFSLIAVTFIYAIILNMLVKPGIDQGVLISGYLGLILMFAAVLAIGVAISSLFSNQIAAFFATLAVILLLWMISFAAQNMSGAFGSVMKYLDLSEHFYSTFYAGIIQLKDIVYYLSVLALALMLGTVSVETRRWR